MSKKMSVLVCVCAMVCLAGCSHNAITYGDGINLETTINPQTYSVGFTLRYGKILSVICRENTKIKMNGTGKGNAGLAGTGTDSSNASADGAVEIVVGSQATGYLVSLAEVDKTLAEKLIDKMYKDAQQAEANKNTESTSK